MKTIQKNITTVNRTVNSSRTIKQIVVHYTANNGDTAYNNTVYFKSTNRNASAHYFVDESSIWQCVEDKDTAWHVGDGSTSGYYHVCRNASSIGVEMCSRKDSSGKYYFKDEVVQNTVELVQYLMKKYNIGIDNVIRHYDVTHKICPAPYCNTAANNAAWAAFKEKVAGTSSSGGSTSSGSGSTTSTKVLYRVRKTWADAKSQKDAFESLANAKACADKNPGYSVFDANGKSVYTSSVASSSGTGSSGSTSASTKKKDLITRLQKELNTQFKAGLTVDGIWGPKTLAAVVTVKKGAKGNITKVLQEALILHGYSVGSSGADGDFGANTEAAVKKFQAAKKLSADGIAGQKTFAALLG